MITSEHHDSALSSPGILFVFLSIHVVFLISFSLYSRESREKRRDIKLNKRERERDGRGGGKEISSSNIADGVLYVNELSSLDSRNSSSSTTSPHSLPFSQQSPVLALMPFYGCSSVYYYYFFFSLFFLVFFNGFPQVK